MNTKIILVLFLLLPVLHAQNNKPIISNDSLVGIWQANSNLLAAGLNDNYQFYKDNTFKYNFNSMSCGMRRIWSIIGSYKISKNQLILTITSTYESVGGHIEEAGTEEGENGFMIVGDKMEIIKQDKPSILYFTLSKNNNKERSLEINFQKFYKLSNNPKEFD